MKLYSENSSIEELTRTENINALKSLLKKPTPELTTLGEQSNLNDKNFKITNGDLTALKHLLLKPQSNSTTVVSSKHPIHCDGTVDALKKMLLGPNESRTNDERDIAALKQLLLSRSSGKSPVPQREPKISPKVDFCVIDNETRPQVKKVKKNSPLRRHSPISSQGTQLSLPNPSDSFQLPITPKHRVRSGSQSSSDFCEIEKEGSSFYAGSSFMNSPSPEAIPLPDFDEIRQFDFESSSCKMKPVEQASCKTESLRRLLKL